MTGEALREALLNACINKDYADTGVAKKDFLQ